MSERQRQHQGVKKKVANGVLGVMAGAALTLVLSLLLSKRKAPPSQVN